MTKSSTSADLKSLQILRELLPLAYQTRLVLGPSHVQAAESYHAFVRTFRLSIFAFFYQALRAVAAETNLRPHASAPEHLLHA